MAQHDLLVEGMNCSGCVASVSKRLLAVPGVTDVTVDLVPRGTSAVTITGDSTVSSADLEAAVVASGKRVAAITVG